MENAWVSQDLMILSEEHKVTQAPRGMENRSWQQAALAHQDITGIGKSLEECRLVASTDKCLCVHEIAGIGASYNVNKG